MMESSKHTYSLIEVINREKSSKIAEIGVWKSSTCKAILKKCSTIIHEYWAVDQWKVLPPKGFGRMGNRTEEQWDQMHAYTCSLCIYFPQLKVVRATSISAASIFKPGYFDLVYIDADHRYEEVLKDIKSWLPLVKKGGYIAGHDYGSDRHTGVKKAVDDLFHQTSSILLLPGEVWLKKC